MNWTIRLLVGAAVAACAIAPPMEKPAAKQSGSARAASTSTESKTPIPVQLSVAIWRVKLKDNKVDQANLDELNSNATTKQLLRSELDKLGQVDILFAAARHLDVADGMDFSIGEAVPIPSSSGPSHNGTFTTTVSYQDQGAILEISEARELDSDRIWAKLALEQSSTLQSNVKITQDHNAPIFWKYSDKFSSVFHYGRPQVLATMNYKTADDPYSLVVTRIVVTKTDD